MAENENTTKKVSISERTHAKNGEYTHIVNSIIAELGPIYQPNNDLILSAEMVEFETNFESLSQGLNAAIFNEQTKVGEQIAAFKLVSGRVGKIIKVARGQGLSPEYLEYLRSTANRLNGIRVNKNTPDNSPDTPPSANANGTVSVSRRSYAGILESLGLLDEQIKGNPDYKPNETEYQAVAISAWIASLRTIHDAALDAKIATRTARNARNSYIYHPTTGLIVRMRAIKAYLETILDKNDPRLKQIKKLRFVDFS